MCLQDLLLENTSRFRPALKYNGNGSMRSAKSCFHTGFATCTGAVAELPLLAALARKRRAELEAEKV